MRAASCPAGMSRAARRFSSSPPRYPRTQWPFSNMPVASTDALAGGLKRVHFARHAEDVVLPAVLRHGRLRASAPRRRRRRRRRRGQARRHGQRRVRARCSRAHPALLQRLFRHAVSAAEARPHRRSRHQPVLRRHGELGRDLLFRARPADRSHASPPKATSRTSTSWSRTRWRISGSATSSPWRGGTICG